MSVQMLVLLVPVIFGLMGFALDLGRLYLIRGELTQAAQAMATTAAAHLIGTDQGLADASTAARLTLEDSAGHGNKYNFGSLLIGDSNGTLASEVPDPTYFSTAAGAIGEDSSSADTGGAPGSAAKYVRVSVTADAPLLFWSLLSLGQDRRTPVSAQAVAGISPPLCTACGIEPFAVAALSADDTVDFGFTAGTKYTFGFQCNGAPVPAALAGTTQRLPYLIVDRYNSSSTFDETQQLYRIGAQGLLPAASPTYACMTAAAAEIAWASAQPPACGSNSVPASVTQSMCGIASRFDPAAQTACANITDVDTLSSAYQADTDVTDIDDYSTYIGNARRVITVPIVDTLVAAGPMTVLGFRQFLVDPNQGDVNITAADSNGRFGALYIGSVAPVKQGRFDGGCALTSGPGKVVLHR